MHFYLYSFSDLHNNCIYSLCHYYLEVTDNCGYVPKSIIEEMDKIFTTEKMSYEDVHTFCSMETNLIDCDPGESSDSPETIGSLIKASLRQCTEKITPYLKVIYCQLDDDEVTALNHKLTSIEAAYAQLLNEDCSLDVSDVIYF